MGVLLLPWHTQTHLAFSFARTKMPHYRHYSITSITALQRCNEYNEYNECNECNDGNDCNVSYTITLTRNKHHLTSTDKEIATLIIFARNDAMVASKCATSATLATPATLATLATRCSRCSGRTRNAGVTPVLHLLWRTRNGCSMIYLDYNRNIITLITALQHYSITGV